MKMAQTFVKCYINFDKNRLYFTFVAIVVQN